MHWIQRAKVRLYLAHAITRALRTEAVVFLGVITPVDHLDDGSPRHPSLHHLGLSQDNICQVVSKLGLHCVCLQESRVHRQTILPPHAYPSARLWRSSLSIRLVCWGFYTARYAWQPPSVVIFPSNALLYICQDNFYFRGVYSVFAKTVKCCCLFKTMILKTTNYLYKIHVHESLQHNITKGNIFITILFPLVLLNFVWIITITHICSCYKTSGISWQNISLSL